jgi:hypothetical protein
VVGGLQLVGSWSERNQVRVSILQLDCRRKEFGFFKSWIGGWRCWFGACGVFGELGVCMGCLLAIGGLGLLENWTAGCFSSENLLIVENFVGFAVVGSG